MASQLASYAQINPKLTPSDVFIFELSERADRVARLCFGLAQP